MNDQRNGAGSGYHQQVGTYQVPNQAHDGSTPRRPVSLARPYARTGGRTQPEQDLSLDALVTTSEQGRAPGAARTVEHRTICDFCSSGRTVSDIVAELGLPLGVVKIVVADMARLGLVLVHQPGLAFGDAESQAFMLRILEGLRQL